MEVDDVEGGYLYVEMLTTVNQEQNIAQILLENLLLGLQSIENENTEFIQIKQSLRNRRCRLCY